MVPHARAGGSKVVNFLPAHTDCNRMRRFYGPDEIRALVTLGVYAKTEIQEGTELGRTLAVFFEEKLKARAARRKHPPADPLAPLRALERRG